MTGLHVHTRHPIAATSVDHLHPRGTKNDNSTNVEFIRRLFSLLSPRSPIVLDLGCSGGGFVQSVLDAGALAIGIEGSDYSKRAARAAWAQIPRSLFTADLGMPLLILDELDSLFCSFNVATAWEVLEHLDRDQLEMLNLTLHAHMARHAYFIASINSTQDHFEGVDYHATVELPEWWIGFFSMRGWRVRRDLVAQFDNHWVRGPNTEGVASTCFVFEKT